ncbi:hypothetical protein CK203_003100 [Vitis vinifera]|uniref:Uncharacterized protein n=1 Tax=Vitis vinifera TaxID=29760 RepID=A0A438K7K8_VITVI|nr:hypothetical protein CK203_003100 [Vitis vinifera]
MPLQVFFAQLMLADMNKELKGLSVQVEDIESREIRWRNPFNLCVYSRFNGVDNEVVSFNGCGSWFWGLMKLGVGNSWPRWWLNDHLICIKGGWVVDIWDPLAEGGWGDETLVFQEPLMIGRWRRQKTSWNGYMGRECVEMWKTWCFGLKQRVE